MRLLFTALALLPVPRLPAAAPNCDNAHDFVDKLVCSSQDLSRVDSDLNRAYAALPARLSPASVAMVRADQRQWLVWLRKVCPQNDPAIQLETCLQTQYNARLDQLTKDIRRVNGILFYTRAQYVYAPGEAPAKTSDDARFDPGFGYGAFAWPQIDSPDRDHAAFNKAAHDAAIRTEAITVGNKKPTSFEEGAIPSGSVDAFTSIFAADEHLVDVDLSAERYEWGGAHPTTDRYTVLWSVPLQRPLTALDIFRDGSPWQTRLLASAIAKLRKSDAGPNLWEGKELTDSVTAALRNPQQWDLSREGLALNFGQYQVTCYACGTPRISFSWAELAPYLNPGFKPSQLPQPSPDPAQ